MIPLRALLWRWSRARHWETCVYMPIVPIPRADMSNRTKDRLAYYLKQLNKEELKDFQSRALTPVAPSTCVMDVASTLVSWFGEYGAWFLAFQTWEEMGMEQLCSQAQQEKDRVLSEYTQDPNPPLTVTLSPSVKP